MVGHKTEGVPIMDRLFAILEPAANISVAIFMVGSLLDMGLKLMLQDALNPDVREG